MMMRSIACALLAVCVVVVFAQSPNPPQFPKQFIAQVLRYRSGQQAHSGEWRYSAVENAERLDFTFTNHLDHQLLESVYSLHNATHRGTYVIREGPQPGQWSCRKFPASPSVFQPDFTHFHYTGRVAFELHICDRWVDHVNNTVVEYLDDHISHKPVKIARLSPEEHSVEALTFMSVDEVAVPVSDFKLADWILHDLCQ